MTWTVKKARDKDRNTIQIVLDRGDDPDRVAEDLTWLARARRLHFAAAFARLSWKSDDETPASRPGAEAVEAASEAFEVSFEPLAETAAAPPQPRWHTALALAAGAVGGAALWSAGAGELLTAPMTWTKAGLGLLTLLLLVGLERAVLAVELMIQAYRLDRRAADELRRLGKFTPS